MLVELWGKEIKVDDVVFVVGMLGYELLCVVVLCVLFVIM